VSLPLYTASQVRAIDQRLIAAGTPGITLMQRAGEAALRALRQRWPQTTHVIVVCGKGNNGGDGHVLAGLLLQTGAKVHVLQIGDIGSLSGDARTAADKAATLGVATTPYSPDQLASLLALNSEARLVIVDAMLGTGFHGTLQGDFADAVEQINNSGRPVLAIDIPSGLHADTGHVAGDAVSADATVTFIARKRGLYTGDGPDYVGDVVFDDCGAASATAGPERPAVRAIDAELLTAVLKPRLRSAHKGHAGSVLVIGGDAGFGGAAMMAAEAAARSGAGTISLLTRPVHVSAMLARRPEIMVCGMDDWQGDAGALARQLVEKASVLVIGPGLGQSAWSRHMLQNSMMWATTLEKPLVLDADALNLAAQDDKFWAESAVLALRRQWVITPHPGEAARLLATTTAQVQCDRFAAIVQLQALTGTQCLLKGAGSLLAFACADDADRPPLDLCTEGNPGMASGGMGDILTGVIAALIAQGLSSADALRCAVCAHGEAADQAVASLGERGLLATDVLSFLPNVLNTNDK